MSIRLDDPRPPYLQVADILRDQIATGDLQPGQQLPSARELASMYDIAPMTAQSAVRVLKDRGLVVTQQGRGVFVHQSAASRIRDAMSGEATNIEQLQQAGITDIWPRTDHDANADLLRRITNARSHITVFGLTRNFYAWDNVLPVLEARASQIPVTIYVMDPYCESRADRYRLEPLQATLDAPGKYVREVLLPLHEVSERIEPTTQEAGLRLFTFNFPCSFSIEHIDEHIRVALYGHGRRGTDSPVMMFRAGTPYFDYFNAQLEWLTLLATEPPKSWADKGLAVTPVTPELLSRSRRNTDQ
jgi:DNA-binding transcriptional regulator YhcF (GntR family)